MRRQCLDALTESCTWLLADPRILIGGWDQPKVVKMKRHTAFGPVLGPFTVRVLVGPFMLVGNTLPSQKRTASSVLFFPCLFSPPFLFLPLRTSPTRQGTGCQQRSYKTSRLVARLFPSRDSPAHLLFPSEQVRLISPTDFIFIFFWRTCLRARLPYIKTKRQDRERGREETRQAPCSRQ